MMQSRKTIAIPPGATIREQLENRGMSQKEFALRMGISEKHISHLINGKVELTHDVALRLESVLGVPARFWNNMEALYREQLARVREELDFENDESVAAKMPYSKCVSLGWIEKTNSLSEKVINLRKYFEVANLGILENLQLPGIAYRAKRKNISKDYALAMWAQKARIEARAIQTSAINLACLSDYLQRIRSLTTEEPSMFCRELGMLMPQCGIAIVFLPHIDGSFLHGAAFVDGNRIVLGLSVRGKYADMFWFSLFHELGHILLGHIMNPQEDEGFRESEADDFAQNALIPKDKYDAFTKSQDFSVATIQHFSRTIGIAPSIVIGRLQRDNFVPYNRYNDMKVKYDINE